jgi:SAM-dependent methyltransferase
MEAGGSDTASVTSPASIRVLDAGCGEGYYVGAIHRELRERGFRPECFGIDISPLAVSGQSSEWVCLYISSLDLSI